MVVNFFLYFAKANDRSSSNTGYTQASLILRSFTHVKNLKVKRFNSKNPKIQAVHKQ